MKPTILIMDSNAHALEQLQGMLRRENYNTFVAVDGHAALRLVEKQAPNLIISDIFLDGLDGYKVWETLYDDEHTRHIPILAVSALTVPPPHEPYQFTSDSDPITFRYTAYLPKPIDLRRLVRMVDKLVYPEQNQTTITGSSIIVAIEDQPLRDEVGTILHASNFGVERPDSLKQAERFVRTLPPAAIIFDYRQPSQTVRAIAIQTRKLVPSTAIILIINPQTELDESLRAVSDQIVRTPLHETYTASSIAQTLELNSRRQRNNILTAELTQTQQNLVTFQQELRAQNEELQHINDKLREIDSLKESFTGMVVHDLKSPLSAMLGAINFMLIDPRVSIPERNKAMLNGAIGAGNQMLRLIETLLEGQRLQDGRAELDLEPFDLIDLVNDSLERILPLITLHHLTTQETIPTNLPPIYADPYMSQRVLENLLDNAIKFSPRDTTITISATVNGSLVTVEVQDQGSGIPKAQQAHIFERFNTVKESGKLNNRSGFGLGLAFCQQATEAMGGRIWVESDGESGTTFFFTLPVYNEKAVQADLSS